MKLEYLCNFFLPNDSLCGFTELFQVCAHVAVGRISRPIVKLLNANRLLAMKKEPSGIFPLAVGARGFL